MSGRIIPEGVVGSGGIDRLVDLAYNCPIYRLDQPEVGYDAGGSDGVAQCIANAEFGWNGTALLEHARTVRIDRLEDAMCCHTTARAGAYVLDNEPGLARSSVRAGIGRSNRNKVRPCGQASSSCGRRLRQTELTIIRSHHSGGEIRNRRAAESSEFVWRARRRRNARRNLVNDYDGRKASGAIATAICYHELDRIGSNVRATERTLADLPDEAGRCRAIV